MTPTIEHTGATPTSAAVAPIGLGTDEGEAIWAFGCLITVKASRETTGGVVTVLDHLAGRGAGSPLHVHAREDEWFYGKVIDAPAGSFVFGPRGVPHTFTVTSDEARFLLVTEPAGLEGMIRELGEPAVSQTIPPAPTEPPDLPRIVQVCAGYGIEILGPPGIPA
jgi:hypothetical protein